MPQLSDITTGQDWAYGVSARDPLIRVQVIDVGTGSNPRVKVRFVDDDERREEWVSAKRLKTPWPEAARYEARMAKLAAVEAVSAPSYDTPDLEAATTVLRQLPTGLLEVNWRKGGGYIIIHDLQRLTVEFAVPSALFEDPAAFTDDDDGSYVAPWVVTERLARHVAPRYADRLLGEVGREEARCRHGAIYGGPIGERGPDPIRPEVWAELTEKYQPTWDLIREWCGQGQASAYDEPTALKEEVSKLVGLVEDAILVLEASGQTHAASTLSRRLEARRSGKLA
jgi:hypothetical protein